MKIAIDAMGGDHAPKEIVEGAILAAQERKEDREIILVGDPVRIQKILDKHHIEDLNIVIYPASEVIQMHESPVQGLRKKKDSSISRAVDLVKKGQAEAVVSAGNTGACVAASKLKLRFLSGIDRPAIAASMPSIYGRNILIDAGATVDCTPRQLLEFAVMGDVYAKFALKKNNPRIGVLSVGEEEAKGNELSKKIFKVFSELPFNFIGNVEGRDIFRNVVDVIVTDGFVGNVALKAAEGGGRLLLGIIKQEVAKSWSAKLGSFLMLPAFNRVKKIADYAETGGAPLLGVNGVCIICHGRSTAKAIKNAIAVAESLVSNKVNRHIEEEFEKMRLHLEHLGETL